MSNLDYSLNYSWLQVVSHEDGLVVGMFSFKLKG